MQEDIVFAKNHHIPILPFMMEYGLNDLYAKPEHFGKLQYLDPLVHDERSMSFDITAIGYEEKLRKFLMSVLIDDETAKRIRAAFDAYIFLSYRKKDRRYANELLHLIHADPVCQNIAVWYDEFLVPGESFEDSIKEAMQKSGLFALLVTPNLINEDNYVRDIEYPTACKAQMKVLPIEAVKTDPQALSNQYAQLPECVRIDDSAEIRKRLLDNINRIAHTAVIEEPIHNFLIGLAYLEGIDVEKNIDRAIELITLAARADLPEAMEKLPEILYYYCGSDSDHDERIPYWMEKIYLYYASECGAEHPKTLKALANLMVWTEPGPERLKTEETLYATMCRVLGEKDPNPLWVLEDLALTNFRLDDEETCISLLKQAYKTRCDAQGEDAPATLHVLDQLSGIYETLGDYEQTLETEQVLYHTRCRVLGEEHPQTISSLTNIAYVYGYLGDETQKLWILKQLYATIYKAGNPTQKLAVEEPLYETMCGILGEDHPDTLTVYGNMAMTYAKLGNYQKALEIVESVYMTRRRVLGEDHPKTLSTLRKKESLIKYLRS